ncbi:hypothetical protein FNW25_07265 [Flavobacterium franklandianum]|uniref:Uncharacterized protein n=1 Tax=Flavobacterium franklandianum TaxID=2594430 RepID=A0A553CSZ6_9FLAO|nr:hypothetical protein [Flavobacterium franklandianum]TRX23652.1 hypothetical protein FNW17_00280 [Flavobacterium franklandianum]TRX27051.1 hypothetical protein FNW25_07265 [Flavobacterium franklandianum]
MKWFFKILVLSILLQSFQCTDTNDSSENITSAQLETKKLEIQNYINSFSCSESGGCNYIAFGSKPCGGPRTYLVFSNSVNLNHLQDLVTKYNEIDNLHNIQTNAISDCSVPLPPNEIRCVNGICTIIN